jgi:serine/threonine protein kinase
MEGTTLQAGKQICPGHQLRRLRGTGGFGSVWEAENEGGELVALKFLPCRDSLVAAQEVRAIQVVRQFWHPNLIRIHQVSSTRGYVVVSMELADGSMYDLLEAYGHEAGGCLPPLEICSSLTQIADVLDFLNARRHEVDGQRVAIQHCDVKPTNLLLCGDRVKLSDFGLSSITGSALRFHRRAGTLDFAAPEIFQGRLSNWSDQYALAVSYFQLRTGQLPFTDTPRTFQRGYVRPLPDLSPLSSAEQQIIGRALNPVPQDRWPTSREMMDQLSRAFSAEKIQKKSAMRVY